MHRRCTRTAGLQARFSMPYDLANAVGKPERPEREVGPIAASMARRTRPSDAPAARGGDDARRRRCNMHSGCARSTRASVEARVARSALPPKLAVMRNARAIPATGSNESASMSFVRSGAEDAPRRGTAGIHPRTDAHGDRIRHVRSPAPIRAVYGGPSPLSTRKTPSGCAVPDFGTM